MSMRKLFKDLFARRFTRMDDAFSWVQFSRDIGASRLQEKRTPTPIIYTDFVSGSGATDTDSDTGAKVSGCFLVQVQTVFNGEFPQCWFNRPFENIAYDLPERVCKRFGHALTLDPKQSLFQRDSVFSILPLDVSIA